VHSSFFFFFSPNFATSLETRSFFPFLVVKGGAQVGVGMPLAHKIKGRELIDEVSRPKRIENAAMREVRGPCCTAHLRPSLMSRALARMFGCVVSHLCTLEVSMSERVRALVQRRACRGEAWHRHDNNDVSRGV
jgi:hypothetical protein